MKQTSPDIANKLKALVRANDRHECQAYLRPTDDELTAIRKLADGQADGYDQVLALKFILVNICRIDDTPYIAGNPSDSVFLGGRHFCGNEILSLIKKKRSDILTLEKIAKEEKPHG